MLDHEGLSNLSLLLPPPPESVELPPSGDCPSTREWVLVGNFKSSHLGSRKRLPELEKMKQTKAGSGMTIFIYYSICSLPSAWFVLQTIM